MRTKGHTYHAAQHAPDALPIAAHERLMLACISAGGFRIDDCLADPAIDWRRFAAQCVRHGIAQQAAVALRPYSRHRGLPAHVRETLERLYEGNAARNAVMFGALGPVLRGLGDAHIPCLVLKGAALSQTIYADPALRPFADLDILVGDSNLARASEIAESCGFQRSGSAPHARQHHVTYVAQSETDILGDTMVPEYDEAVTPEILARDGRKIKLEIHRSVLRHPSGFARQTDQAAFWQHSETMVLPCGTLAQVPNTEAMFAHLCEHAAHHGYNRLLFACDVALLLETAGGGIDWARLSAIAAETGVTEHVHAFIGFVLREFSISCVPQFQETLAGDAGATQLCWADMFQAMRTDVRTHYWNQIRGSGPREFLLACRHMLFPPPAFMRDIHGDRAPLVMAALYLVRPFDLARKLALVHYNRGSKAPKTPVG